MTLERLRERLDQGLAPGKLGALPGTYSWVPVLQAAFTKHRLINDLMEFPEPRGVIFSGSPGNGRHTTASALVNSRGGHYLWLSGWDLDREDSDDSCEIIRNVVRLAYEQGKLILLLDGPENCRHSMLIQEYLARLLNNMDDGVLTTVIVTEDTAMISTALRHHLLLCPCAAPTKTERQTWFKQKLEKPVPLKIDGMDQADLVKKTDGFSWQQLQDLQNHLKLLIFRQLLNRQAEFKERKVTLEEALKAGLVTVSNPVAEILIHQVEDRNPKPQAIPTVQVIGGGVAGDPNAVNAIDTTSGMSKEDTQELIRTLSDPANMDPNALFNFDF